MQKSRYPTPDEWEAIERAARRARAQEVARLARAVATAIEARAARVMASASGRRTARHGPVRNRH